MVGGDIKSLPGLSIANRSEHGFHKVKEVKVWSRRGRIFQVGVSQGYRGLIDGAIGIGSTIGQIEGWCSCEVVEGKYESLVAYGTEGWSFFVEEPFGGDRNMNRNARVTSIWIYSLAAAVP